MSMRIGLATAYGYAKSKGYQGTEEEFAEYLAGIMSAAASAAASAEEAAQYTSDAVGTWLAANMANPDSPPLDRTLEQALAAAPADMVGDLKSAMPYIFTGAMKTAILNLFSKTAYVDDDGQDYIDTLSALFFPGVASITAVFTQPQTDILTTDSLDSLKSNLVVTAMMTDTSTQVVPSSDYILSGILSSGISTITVTYAGKTTTFDCLVAYILDSSVVLDGTDNINTHWKTTYADNISVCFDVTLTGFSGSSKPDFVWSNVGSGTGDDYIGFITRLATNGEYQAWGAGIPNSSTHRVGVITGTNERLRAVSCINCTTGKTTIKYYNVTNDITQSRESTYTVANIVTNKDIVVGHPIAQSYMYGMQGTVHEFEVHGRELTSAEIDSYLAGE